MRRSGDERARQRAAHRRRERRRTSGPTATTASSKNIFGLQDTITRNVVKALSVELTKDDSERVAKRGTAQRPRPTTWSSRAGSTTCGRRPTSFAPRSPTSRRPPSSIRTTGARTRRSLRSTGRATRATGARRCGFGPQTRDAQYDAEQYLAKAMRDPTPLAHQVASAMLRAGAAARGGHRRGAARGRERSQRCRRLHRARRRAELRRQAGRGARGRRARDAAQSALPVELCLPARARAVRPRTASTRRRPRSSAPSSSTPTTTGRSGCCWRSMACWAARRRRAAPGRRRSGATTGAGASPATIR